MKTINTEIEALLETMHEQFMQIKQYESKIPQIELDLLLSNLRKTYEFTTKLNKLNNKEELITPSVNTLKKEITPPVFAEAKLEKTETEEVKKEPALKLKSTTLPFEIPQLNFFRKETTSPLAETQEIVKPEPVAIKKESTLKLKSTTFPDNPLFSALKEEKATIAAPVQEIVFAPSPDKNPVETSINTDKEIEIKFETILPPLPEPEQQEQVAVAASVQSLPPAIDVKKIEVELEDTTIFFEMDTNSRNQEALNVSREKIFKEESFVHRINPLTKIASLFEDTLSVQDKSRESFSILDKFMKKKEDTSVAEMLRHTPITDLKTAIGINEKFKFINELFGGNYEDYNASIDLINKCKSFTDAEIFIAENVFDKYKWEIENRNVADFMDLVERRFL